VEVAPGQIAGFLEITPSSLLKNLPIFERGLLVLMYCEMEGADVSETSVYLYQSTRRHISEDNNLFFWLCAVRLAL
jgi:hypothetical protein